MKIKADRIQSLIEEIEEIGAGLQRAEAHYQQQIDNVHPAYRQSAQNLVHYRALRSIDITAMQKTLGNLGLSRLARAESHVLASLKNCKFILQNLIGDSGESSNDGISIKKASKSQRRNTKNLLGYRSKGRRVRIMVTLPSEAANDYDLVHNLLESGMNTARINCAHDGPEQWKKMIDHIAVARKKLKKNCRISMDLAGPKIRTGEIEKGPKVLRFRPSRNVYGKTTEPARIILASQTEHLSPQALPVENVWLAKLKVGDEIHLSDARNKNRILTVEKVADGEVTVTCPDTSYVETGTSLMIEESKSTCKVGELPALEQSLSLKTGDTLRVIRENIAGRPAEHGEDGKVINQAFISCTSQEVFQHVKVGERILFDDGKIAGKITAVTKDEITVEITHAKGGGSNLRSDKGINLPQTNLQMEGLTAKDREDLRFVVAHADVINFSFVNTPEDVRSLLAELEKLGATDKLGIILKIETQKAYNNLTDILLEGMRNYPLGVMIARGDLAIESGWENMARVQQEILLLSNAAHIPDVWATQVLETLAKKGIPSRSEITDAATALNADCVMLNKGPYILQALDLLDYILKSLDHYQDKNIRMFPVLEKAEVGIATASD